VTEVSISESLPVGEKLSAPVCSPGAVGVSVPATLVEPTVPDPVRVAFELTENGPACVPLAISVPWEIVVVPVYELAPLVSRFRTLPS
jgi:hypothetical protein